MTVQELIEALQAIEDKSLQVYSTQIAHEGFNIIEYVYLDTSDNTVVLS